MSGTSRQPTAQSGGRHASSLADSQLEHLENMVEHLTRGGAADVLHGLDHAYWEKRIRALEQTHELIVSQQRRIGRLLERLASEARVELKRRTAA
ncbi:conserved hypothetical protein [Paraburkholderia ribeironis]|uniref:Uncharacterized protein n=1 Tax=Paraburkholderia ribeironis TaxID=1247936 RepID=A0A1N7SEK2_9BURK|nr:hypothetical protein [Paraburkholderia ribeironis]SIT45399.1 conserved hypothetical protein [Paraburkholderia ribeironis]